MKYKSQLALIVATQLGNLQGRLEANLLVKLRETVVKYQATCPNVNSLRRTISLLNNVNKVVAVLEKTKNTFKKTSDRLTPVINSLTTLTNVLRTLPIPTAVAGVGVPIGFTNRYAELLNNTSTFLDNLKEEKAIVDKLLNSTDGITDNIAQVVVTLQALLTKCITENPDLKPLLEEFQRTQSNLPVEGLASNLGLGPNNSYKASNGRVYFFEIINDTSLDAPVNRRLAVAKDNTGIVIIKGEPSFSSSTKVLIDELKLRIERQLP